jgi:hypothetical protein
MPIPTKVVTAGSGTGVNARFIGPKVAPPRSPAVSKLPFPENISSPKFPVLRLELLKVKVRVSVDPLKPDSARAAGVVCELSTSVPRLVVVALSKNPRPTPELVSALPLRRVVVLMVVDRT